MNPSRKALFLATLSALALIWFFDRIVIQPLPPMPLKSGCQWTVTHHGGKWKQGRVDCVDQTPASRTAP